MRRGPIAAILTLAVACGDAPSSSSATSSATNTAAIPDKPGSTGATVSAIQNGEATQGLASAVALCVGPSPATCLFACSATLIAPNMVMTARHCLQAAPSATSPTCGVDQFGGNNAGVTDTTVWVTTNATAAASASGWHRSKQLVYPAANTVCGGDIAAVVLQDSVTKADATPATLALTPALSDASWGRTVVLAGYGETSVSDAAAGSGLGTRRFVQNVPIVCIPGDAYVDCTALNKNTGRSTKEFLVLQGACKGDSGGPVFDQVSYNQSRYMVFGALSRASELTGVCTQDTYTRVDAFAAFLHRAGAVAAVAGSYPPPAWATATISGVQPGASTPFAFGELGAECEQNSDCTSGQCTSRNNGLTYTCTEACSASGSCPANFECVTTSAAMCFYKAPAPAPSGPCSMRAPADTVSRCAGVAFAVATMVAVAVGRRRRRVPENRRTLQ